jgi:hypothetical protein
MGKGGEAVTTTPLAAVAAVPSTPALATAASKATAKRK